MNPPQQFSSFKESELARLDARAVLSAVLPVVVHFVLEVGDLKPGRFSWASYLPGPWMSFLADALLFSLPCFGFAALGILALIRERGRPNALTRSVAVLGLGINGTFIVIYGIAIWRMHGGYL